MMQPLDSRIRRKDMRRACKGIPAGRRITHQAQQNITQQPSVQNHKDPKPYPEDEEE